MAYDEGHARSSDGPTCLVAILAPFLVVCAIVGYATLDGGGITQRDEQTDTVQVLTWHGWARAGEPARQLFAPPAPAFGAANPTTVPLPTPRPAPPAVLVAPTVGDVALAPAAGSGSGTTSRSAGYGAVEPDPAAPVAAAGLSPWTVLGWVLVVLVPATLLLLASLAVYRTLLVRRVRGVPTEARAYVHEGGAARIRERGHGGQPGGPVPADDIETTAESDRSATGTAEERVAPAAPGSTYIADFLSAERRPEMVAAGGYHDATVPG